MVESHLRGMSAVVWQVCRVVTLWSDWPALMMPGGGVVNEELSRLVLWPSAPPRALHAEMRIAYLEARERRMPALRGWLVSGTARRLRSCATTAIDEDWNCPWPLDWQRHYRHLADLAADEPHGRLPDIAPGVLMDGDDLRLPDIAPGVLMDGDDLGRWLQRQKQPDTWAQLAREQQQRLTELGVTPA
ncbi:hypothetical protein AMK32_23320 [Streptomyces sp. CB01883]|nr:hypothetical protein AMK32_23320 [Streptomyces sp. CB01883]